MNRYRTVFGAAEAEQVIERSRFIARVMPAETREEAESFIAETRLMNRDATHNVPAMVLGEGFQVQWASDDGEPQGTAGAPIVQMLVKEGITNIAVVVTRHFGGVKLGTGGLVRAYTGCVKKAVSAAVVCRVKELSVLTFKAGYSSLDRIQNAARGGSFLVRGVEYAESVTIVAATEPENLRLLKATLDDITAGDWEAVSETGDLVKIPE